MCDFVSIVPLLKPFLDNECCALLLAVCKTLHQGFGDLLHPKLPPRVLAQVEECISILSGTRPKLAFGRYVVTSEPGHSTSIALAVHYRCLDTIGVNLRYLSPNHNPTSGFAAVQRRLKTYFNLTTRDLVQLPRLGISNRYDRLAIVNEANGAALLLSEQEHIWPPRVPESTTRFQFHLRPLRLKCDVEGAHEKSACRWSHIDTALEDIRSKSRRLPLVYVLDRPSCRHLYSYIKQWCHFQYHCEGTTEVRDVAYFYAHEGPAIDSIVAFIPANTDAQLVASFKSRLIKTHSHSGKACIDVYVIVDAKDLAGVFFGSWNHVPDNVPLQSNDQCLQDVIDCASIANCTAWSLFNSQFKYLQGAGWRGGGNDYNWIDFSCRLPDRLPYRVYYPLPSQLDSHRGHGTWKSYCIELENRIIRREDGTPALATLSIQ